MIVNGIKKSKMNNINVCRNAINVILCQSQILQWVELEGYKLKSRITISTAPVNLTHGSFFQKI